MADDDNTLGAKWNHRLAYLGCVSVSVGFMTIGLHIGWVNPTISELNDPTNPDRVGSENQSWIAASISFSHVVFTIPAAIMADKVGRKSTLFLSMPPNFICWLMLVFDDGFISMILSRVAAGCAFAIIPTVAPVYMSEIAPDHLRGRMGVAFQFMFNVGMLYEYAIATYIEKDALQLSLTACVPLLFGFFFPWMEESPIYLIRRERILAERAVAHLRGISSRTLINKEMDRIDKSFLLKTSSLNDDLQLLCKKGSLKPLFLGLSLIFFQQMSGFSGLLNYSLNLTQKDEIGPIVYCLSRLVTLCIVPFLVDYWGRRPLLIVSNLLSAISLILLGFYFFAYGTDITSWVIYVLMVFFNVSYTFGSGTLPMVIITELMPSEYRSSALAVSQVVMALAVVFVTKTFLTALKQIGTCWVLWMCSLNCLIGVLFTFLCLPETKGKSFMEIQEELRKPLLIKSSVLFRSRNIVRQHENSTNI